MEDSNYVGKHAKIDANGEPITSESDSSSEGQHSVKESNPWGEEYLDSVPEFAQEASGQPENPTDNDMLDFFGKTDSSSISAESAEGMPSQEFLSESDMKTIISILNSSVPHMNSVREILRTSESAEEFIDRINTLNRNMLQDSVIALKSIENQEADELSALQTEYKQSMDKETSQSQNLLEGLYEVASNTLPRESEDRKDCLQHISSMMDDVNDVRTTVMNKNINSGQPDSSAPYEPSPFL